MELKDFNTLGDARGYSEKVGQLIHRDTLNGWLGEHDIYLDLKNIARDMSHPFRDKIAAFLDSTEYNFIEGDGTTTGDKHLALLDALIDYKLSTNATRIADALVALKPVIWSKANKTVYPLAKTTFAEFERAHDRVPTITKSPTNGYIKLTLSADVERHNAYFYKTIQGVKVRAGSVTLEKAGDYVAAVQGVVEVENFYNVLS